MKTTFGKILELQPSAVPLLVQCFACMIHHADAMIRCFVKVPGHQFTKLHILHNRELLTELKCLVTTAPTSMVMQTATGIPPHIHHARQLASIAVDVETVASNMAHQTTRVVEAV